MKKYEKLIIYTDGGARGNPGPAGIGVLILNDQSEKLAEISEFIGEATNNQAEYRAVLKAIKKAGEYTDNELHFYLDSELVVRQLSGEYRVKNKDLAPMFVKIYNETLGFKKVKFSHIPREKNKEADRLANLAMDKGF